MNSVFTKEDFIIDIKETNFEYVNDCNVPTIDFRFALTKSGEEKVLILAKEQGMIDEAKGEVGGCYLSFYRENGTWELETNGFVPMIDGNGDFLDLDVKSGEALREAVLEAAVKESYGKNDSLAILNKIYEENQKEDYER